MHDGRDKVCNNLMDCGAPSFKDGAREWRVGDIRDFLPAVGSRGGRDAREARRNVVLVKARTIGGTIVVVS